jgi:hypothetical protein
LVVVKYLRTKNTAMARRAHELHFNERNEDRSAENRHGIAIHDCSDAGTDERVAERDTVDVPQRVEVHHVARKKRKRKRKKESRVDLRDVIDHVFNNVERKIDRFKHRMCLIRCNTHGFDGENQPCKKKEPSKSSSTRAVFKTSEALRGGRNRDISFVL